MTVSIRRTRLEDIAVFRQWCTEQFKRESAEENRENVDWDSFYAELALVYSADMFARSSSFIAEADRRIVGAIMATDTLNSIDGVPEGLIHSFFLADASFTAIGESLIRMLTEAAAARRWRFLRARIAFHDLAVSGAFARHTGWETMGVTVKKKLQPTRLRTIPDVTIRPARQEDLGFIIGLLAEGLWLGLGADERDLFGRDKVAAAAERLLASIIGPSMVVLVADASGVRVGHLTGSLAVAQELTGQVDAMLYDAFVLPEYRDRGISTLLTQVFETIAYEAGCGITHGTVIGLDETHTRRILEQIGQMNYQADRRMLRYPIRSVLNVA